MNQPTKAHVATPKCVHCGKPGVIEIDITDVSKLVLWKSGAGHIQHLFPHWSAGQREQLISGTHPDCWDEITLAFAEFDDPDQGDE